MNGAVGKSRKKATRKPPTRGRATPRTAPSADAVGLSELTAALAARASLPLTSSTAPAPAPRRVGAGRRPDASRNTSVTAAVVRQVNGTEADPPTLRAPVSKVQAASAAGCAETAADHVEGDAVGLSATHWLDLDESDIPPNGSVAIRFVGQRVGTDDQDPRDRFERLEQVDGLLPGSGRVSITTKVVGISPGQWHVTAAPTAGITAATSSPAGRFGLPTTRQITRTRLAPLLHGPGVRQAAWPALVLLGVLVALATQALLVQRAGGNWSAGLAVSAAAVIIGYLGAKAWYLVLHRQGPRKFVPAGTCIQGFLLAGFGTLAIGSALTGAAAGLLLDASTPGLFFAMFTGRPGCFLGGCCVGRPTMSRWGLWSSDRRIGVRRIPVQLLEAAIALALGLATIALFLSGPLPLPGALFVGTVAAYTLGRQLLFPLRREPRQTSSGRLITLAAAGLVVAGAVLASALAA